MPHKVHCSFAKMSVDEKGKCNTIYRLYACLKAICNVKRSIGNLFFRSSFSERMIQVASTTWTGNGKRLEAGPIRGERRHSTCTPGRSGAVSHRPGHHVFPHPVPREPSSSWTASTSRHWAFQSEVARSDLGGTWRKGGNPLGSRREGKRGTPGPLLPPKENARSQSTGCEPATACLEGRWSQDRRLLPVKWL